MYGVTQTARSMKIPPLLSRDAVVVRRLDIFNGFAREIANPGFKATQGKNFLGRIKGIPKNSAIGKILSQ